MKKIMKNIILALSFAIIFASCEPTEDLICYDVTTTTNGVTTFETVCYTSEQ